jgi:hypothetical protein
MTTDAREPKRNYPIPAAGNDIADDFARLIEALTAIGVDVAGLIAALAGKAAAVHGHDQSAITGLVDALAGKASTDHNHALAGLTDVGVAGAAAYQVLALINGLWRPWTIDLTHATGTVSLSSVDGLEAALAGRQPADATLAALAAVVTAADRLIYATGSDTFATAPLTAFARSLLDDANSAAARVTLGLSAAVPGAFGLARLADADLPAAQTALGITAKASLRNRHLNPGFQICQDRATGATVALSASGYAFDGVGAAVNGGGALTCGQVAKPTPGGSPYRARFAVSTADAAIAASDFYGVSLLIEGVDIADLRFGTAAARSFVWRGVVNAPAGTWGLSFHNGAATRSFVVPIVISADQAGTDVPVSVVVPGDVAGAWPSDGANIGIRVNLCIAAGSAFQTAATGTWQTGDFLVTSSQTNGMAGLGNVFELADIGLYAGTELPAWELPAFGEDLHHCQRYWESSYSYGVAPGTPSGTGAWGWIGAGDPTLSMAGASGAFMARKRVMPAISIYNTYTGAPNNAKVNGIDTAVSSTGASQIALSMVYFGSPQTVGAWTTYCWVANARL